MPIISQADATTEVGYPGLYGLSCLLAGRDVASFLKEQVCDFLTTGETQYKTCYL